MAAQYTVDARTRQLQAPSTALVTKHAESPTQDIISERRRASFNTLVGGCVGLGREGGAVRANQGVARAAN